MRYGLFSDVHGNLHALLAALDALRAEKVDAYLCAGDLVGYGAFPDECVERVLELPALCVAGNHDLMALGELDSEGCIPLARASIEWTRAVIGRETRERLAALPRRAATERVVLAHGSLEDPREYVTSRERAATELCHAASLDPATEVLVLGHTHAALAVDDHGVCLSAGRPAAVELTSGRRHLVNPGAVGQSRDRELAARIAILDLDRRRLQFHAVAYDVAAARAALRDRGLPVDSYHLRPPSPWRRTAARGLSGLRAIRARTV